jgi:hypothetical protein
MQFTPQRANAKKMAIRHAPYEPMRFTDSTTGATGDVDPAVEFMVG